MAVDERLLEALKALWYAVDELNDQVKLVVKGVEESGRRIPNFEQKQKAFEGSMTEVRDRMQALMDEVEVGWD